MTLPFRALCLALLISGCSQPAIKRYENLLDEKKGASRTEIDALLGKPAHCKRESPYRKCEYRTSVGRNHPTPIVFKKSPTMAVDVSPYDHFDVLHLYFDADDKLKEWKPVHLAP